MIEEDLEHLSFIVKDPKVMNKLINIHLKEKREFEKTELSKALQTNRAKYIHYVFVTPNREGIYLLFRP